MPVRSSEKVAALTKGEEDSLGPVGTGELVGDQIVGGLGVGDAKEGLGKAHKGDAFVAAKVIGRHEGIDACWLVGAYGLGQ